MHCMSKTAPIPTPSDNSFDWYVSDMSHIEHINVPYMFHIWHIKDQFLTYIQVIYINNFRH